MDNNVYNFLQTDLLERYLIGQTNVSETEQVEYYITNYPVGIQQRQ